MRRKFLSYAFVAVAALAPTVARASDAEDKAAAEQIATILRDSGRMQNYSVGVKYKNGTVWLSGRVTTEQQMQSALEVLSEVEGIDQIVNNLAVGNGGKQAAANRQAGRKVTLVSADIESESPRVIASKKSMMADDGQTVPAGYHQLARKAARGGHPMPQYAPSLGAGVAPAAYDQPHMPNYAWPSYAASPNYAAITYPKQYSASAFPFIGPFYPYPQVPLGWRKVSLEWDDGWWFLDFYDRGGH